MRLPLHPDVAHQLPRNPCSCTFKALLASAFVNLFGGFAAGAPAASPRVIKQNKLSRVYDMHHNLHFFFRFPFCNGSEHKNARATAILRAGRRVDSAGRAKVAWRRLRAQAILEKELIASLSWLLIREQSPAAGVSVFFLLDGC